MRRTGPKPGGSNSLTKPVANVLRTGYLSRPSPTPHAREATTMAIKVTDLTPADIRSVETREKINSLTNTPLGPTRAERDAFAVHHGAYEERDGKRHPARPKYWAVPMVLQACYQWGIEPVLGQGGALKVKKAGGLHYMHYSVPPVAQPAPVTQPVIAPAPTPKPVPVTIPETVRQELRTVAVPAPPASDENARKLAALKALVVEVVEQARSKDEQTVRDLIAGVSVAAAGAAVETTGRALLAALEAANEERIAAALAKIDEARPVVLEIRQNGKPTTTVGGIVHRAFPRILQLAAARKNIVLIGPTGCGKTHLCAQLADALFGQGASKNGKYATQSVTMGMSESKVVGGFMPLGEHGRFEFLIADFVRLYRDGGLFLFDEWDGVDPNVALIVNQALANHHLDLPGYGRIERHADFVCIAAMNTYGNGAGREYVGRSQQDEATLDRFRMGQVEMDYDREVERLQIDRLEKLYGVSLQAWLELCWQVRDRIRGKLRKNISTRFILDGADMVGGQGWPTDVALSQLVRGWSADDVNKAGITMVPLY